MKIVIKLFLISFTLMQVAQAGRMFDPEMGRFISRDPLGYVDGMSLYNGYFAEGFNLDPLGEAEIIFNVDTKDITKEQLDKGIFGWTDLKNIQGVGARLPNARPDVMQTFRFGGIKWDRFIFPGVKGIYNPETQCCYYEKPLKAILELTQQIPMKKRYEGHILTDRFFDFTRKHEADRLAAWKDNLKPVLQKVYDEVENLVEKGPTKEKCLKKLYAKTSEIYWKYRDEGTTAIEKALVRQIEITYRDGPFRRKRKQNGVTIHDIPSIPGYESSVKPDPENPGFYIFKNGIGNFR